MTTGDKIQITKENEGSHFFKPGETVTLHKKHDDYWELYNERTRGNQSEETIEKLIKILS